MKKVISVLLALVFALSGLSVVAFAADESGITEFSVESVINSGSAAIKTEWYEIDGVYYIFLPNAISPALCKINFTATGDVTLDGVQLESGKETTVLKDKTDVTVACGDKQYNVKVISDSIAASVFIETESGSLDYVHADKENKEAGKIAIVNSQFGIEYSGDLDYIKGRGNSTWEMEKKPYNIKLNKSTNIFGMGKSKKWSLIANYDDESLVRNIAAFTAADLAGLDYTPTFIPVDVYINSEYMGAYLLTSRIEADKKRVNVDNLDDVNEEICQIVYDDKDFNMDTLARGGVFGKFSGLLENTKKWVEVPAAPADYGEVDITGGYILEMELGNRYADEISGFVTSRSQPLIMKSPEYASQAQMEYISDYYQRFEDAVFSADGKNSLGESYTDLCDLESLAKVYALNEWADNMDYGLTSSYFYKPARDKLYSGPVWDFDIAFGNNDGGRFGCDYNNPTEFTVCFGRQYRNTIFGKLDVCEKPTIINQLCTRPEFVAEVKKVWDSSVKPAVDATNEMIATFADVNMGSAVMNAIRWNTFGTTDIDEIKTAYTEAVNYVYNFSKTRANFLSANFGTVQTQNVKTNFAVKILKKIGTGVNDLFEKVIVTFNLQNKF
ncbi:MAG: CotH kinase family protein [Acutalibacteraceae bacterium]